MTIKELENSIIMYAEAYYKGDSLISDEEFDLLVEELRSADPENVLLTTTGWGYKPAEGSLNKSNHLYGKVAGLKKFSPEDFLKHFNSVDNISISPKLDGCSVVVYYKNGFLEKALTRGDGEEGLDITDKILALGISKTTCLQGSFRRRGEFVLPLSVWKDKYNKEKSARNIASGFLNRKSWSDQEITNFELIFYTTTGSNGKDFPDDDSDYYCDKDGLKSVIRGRIPVNSLKINKEYLNKILNSYSEFLGGILCDGIVARINDEKCAIKWNQEGVKSTVRDIEWRQSRFNKFTPVIKIDPIEIAGATISNVSGSNYSLLKSKGIGIGSSVLVVRSGQIIPYISEVITKSDDFNLPDSCPDCGSKLVVDGTDLCCKNINCGYVKRRRIHNFINSVCNIDGLGDTIIDKYLDSVSEGNSDLISFVHLYRQNGLQTFDRFKEVPGIGDSAVKLLQKAYDILNGQIPESKFLLGLGIKGFGETSINKALVNNSIDDIINKIESGEEIDGVNIQARYSLFENLDLIRKMMNEVNVVRETNFQDENYSKIKICLTGKLSMTRSKFVKSFNGKVEEVRITNADYLVTNDQDPNSSKGKAAKKLGIKIVNEEQFRNIMEEMV